MTEAPERETSSTGLDITVAGMLAYAGGWVTGLVFFLLEKNSQFVRFHAAQSMMTFVPLFLAFWFVPVWFILWPLSVALWILLMYKALQGERFKLPVVGDLAERRALRKTVQ
jgi:uncharacterized membrane protein